jgi:hypothetical protein
MKEGVKNGHGKYTWPDGSSYVGEYLDDKKHGKGTMTFANGDVYTGAFVWGSMAGEGVYKYKNGDIYRGLFYKGLRDGKGMYHFAEHKCQFVGLFEAGVWPAVQKVYGIWKKNDHKPEHTSRSLQGRQVVSV